MWQVPNIRVYLETSCLKPATAGEQETSQLFAILRRFVSCFQISSHKTVENFCPCHTRVMMKSFCKLESEKSCRIPTKHHPKFTYPRQLLLQDATFPVTCFAGKCNTINREFYPKMSKSSFTFGTGSSFRVSDRTRGFPLCVIRLQNPSRLKQISEMQFWANVRTFDSVHQETNA